MKRKVLVAIMTLIMTLAFMPSMVFAEGAATASDESSLIAAIANGGDIEITADIEVTGPLYIVKDTNIYTTSQHTITRSGGKEIFVVGQTSAGKDVIGDNGDAPVTLNLGDKDSTAGDLLIIDGENTAATGSAIYVANSSTVNLYKNVTIKNCYKTGNNLVKDGDISKGVKAGGAAAIVTSGALNIRGASLTNNKVALSDTTSSLGGAIYNYGTFKMYDGTISGSSAYLGGAVYNYRTVKFFNGTVSGNSAYNGGAIYQADSQYAQTIMGNDKSADSVVFSGNTASNAGGAFYSGTGSEDRGGVNGITVYADANAEFNSNSASHDGGAIATFGTATIEGASFTSNTSGEKAGALYLKDDKATLKDCTFSSNHTDAIATVGEDGEPKRYGGGAIYTTGTELVMDGCVFEGNTSEYNGGALALYSGSNATIKNSVFGGDTAEKGNTANNKYGGAIHLNKAEMTTENCRFANNSAFHGGAVCFYEIGDYGESMMTDTDFDSNQGIGDKYGGGAIYCKTSSFKMNGGSFTNNSQHAYTDGNVAAGVETGEEGNGGALGLYNAGTCVLNDVTFEANTAYYRGGGIYVASANSGADIYNCTFNDNVAGNNGGAIALVSGTTGIRVYNSNFDKNNALAGNRKSSGGTHYDGGGAIYWYSNAEKSILYDCDFTGNYGASYAGATNNYGTLVELYNVSGKDNYSPWTGFLYGLSGGTYKLCNVTTQGANDYSYTGANAYTRIYKTGIQDLDNPIIDYDAYWANWTDFKENSGKGIAEFPGPFKFDNVEFIDETAEPIPANYVEAGIPQNPLEDAPAADPEAKTTTDLDAIFVLADADDPGTDSTYKPGSKLDNSSNFQSRSTASYNINGGTVTADSFVYESGKTANNPNVGEGLLIFQAMQYKKAHPAEPVSIDISSYRFSAEAAVCINRNSDYFGYMRRLKDAEYDQYGFVRIARLLVGAAEMGIDVNVIAQREASTYATAFGTYFNGHMNDACNTTYVADGKRVKDFLKVYDVDWDYSNKSAADLMHTKSCAVTNYRDKDGNDHGKTVWLSSSNLDNIKTDGRNDLDWMQTGVIISDHEDIYRVTKNYLGLITQYDGKDEVYKFRNEVNRRATEQIKAINAGEPVDADKQIVYLGSENDKVFELYFSAIGGDNAKWDETYNMFSKQIRNLYNSEGYILFAMNNPKFNDFSLSSSLQKLLALAFNKGADKTYNTCNKLYVAIGGSDDEGDSSGGSDFDASLFSSLMEGINIGSKTIKSGSGNIHSKDMLLSYELNGQRSFVSMITSMNFHEGSASYQSNFALVIKENGSGADSVFYNIAKNTAAGLLSDKLIDSFNISETEFVYSGNENKPAVSSVKSGGTSVVSSNYDVQYSDNINAGTATVRVIGKKSYSGTATKTFTIKPAEITDGCIAVDSQKYTGEALTPEPIVTVNGATMKPGDDYTVEYSNNTNVGWATVTVTGKGNCSGTASKDFFITSSDKEFNADFVTVEGLKDATYTGSPITQDVSVFINGEPAEESSYAISYENNVNAGTATLIIKPAGELVTEYTGAARHNFNIAAVNVGTLTVGDFDDVTYTGEAFIPAASVKFGEAELVKGQDYTVEYSGNVNAGTASVKITGTGNFTGDITKTFTIGSLNISDAASGLKIADIPEKVYDGKAYTPELTVTYGDVTLAKGTDYDVAYSNNINAGTATATITGKGNFAGTLTKNYVIKPLDLGDAEVSSVADQVYTGSAITPAVTVTYKGETLTEDVHYIVSYHYNTNVGSAVVEVEGIGNYGEYNSTQFNITKATPALTLSSKSLYCNGKTDKPTATVKLNDAVIDPAAHGATVAFPASKKPGTYTVTVSGPNFETVTATYKLAVKPTSIASLGKLKKGFNVKVKKLTSTYSTGYQVRYSLKKSMAGAKTVTISSKASAVSKKVTKLKAKKKYFVQVRTVKKVGTAKCYSAWSAKKTVTTKK